MSANAVCKAQYKLDILLPKELVPRTVGLNAYKISLTLTR